MIIKRIGRCVRRIRSFGVRDRSGSPLKQKHSKAKPRRLEAIADRPRRRCAAALH